MAVTVRDVSAVTVGSFEFTLAKLSRKDIATMTAPHIVDPAHVLGNLLAEASPDMMRSLLQNMINQLLSADADQVCGAEWGQASPGRLVQRNGYRHRPLDTRVGTVDVAVPKLRSGTYFPEWLLERRKRAEAALITVIADCYLAGVSTRRMDKLVKTLGIDGLKSQCPGWPPSWMSTSTSSDTAPWPRQARSRSSPPTR